MTNPRKPGVVLRFCEYELEELDRLIQTYGGLPRSSIVNIALDELLYSPKESDLRMCKKRKVNLIIDPHNLKRLSEHAKSLGVHRTDLIRLALLNFKLKYANPPPTTS